MNAFGIGSMLAGLAAAIAISAAPTAAAGDAQSTQSPAPPTGTASHGTVALPPGGQIDTLPQDQAIGGADPLVPFGTDPFVPSGVWTP